MAIGNAGEKAWSLLSLAFGAVLALLFFHAWTGMMRYATYGSDTIEIPMTTFDGQMWTTNSTVNAVTLASCKYGQFQSHTVRTDNGEIAKEWLWTNDRDQINIMVQIGDGDLFLISRERRYGLNAESYSAVNGYVRLGETPTEAARRILREDYGIIPGDLASMGSYRIQVNRGGGFLHAFLAKRSAALPVSKSGARNSSRITKKMIIMSKGKILDLLMSGKLILEVQWTATLALGALMLEP